MRERVHGGGGRVVSRRFLVAGLMVLGPVTVPSACMTSVLMEADAIASPEGRAAMALKGELEQRFQVDLRSATVLEHQRHQAGHADAGPNHRGAGHPRPEGE